MTENKEPFGKQFPSLEGKALCNMCGDSCLEQARSSDAFNGLDKTILFAREDIEEHCLDKQKVALMLVQLELEADSYADYNYVDIIKMLHSRFGLDKEKN